MTNAKDYVFVGGNYYVFARNGNRNNFTAGTLEIKGNVTQAYNNNYSDSYYGFHATGTHNTILSGNSLQRVSFANIESQFNTLEITKDYNLGYKFNRTPMWVTLIDGSADEIAPEPPRQLQFVRSTATSIYLSWTVPTDNVAVAGYRIYRDGVNVGETTDSSYIDNGLSSDETYGYYITAYDFSGNESAFSNAILATSGADLFAPTQPMNLSAKVKSESTITLTWVGSSDNASVEGYNVYRDDVIVGSVKGTTFTDQNAPGGLYTYYVRAFDNDDNLSVASTAVIIDNMPPTKPILSADKITETLISLSWVSTDNDKVVSYELYKNSSHLKTLTSPSYIDTAVETNTTYTYYAVAFDTYGNVSERSESIKVNTGKDETEPTVNSIVLSNNKKTALITVSATDNRAVSSVTALYSSDKVNWTELPVAVTDGKASSTAKFTFDFSELTDGTWYVRAIATDSSGNVSDSEASPIAEFTVDNTAPHTPFELSSDVANGSINIAWHYDTTDTDVAYFRVYRMKGDNGEYTLIKDNYKYTSIYDNDFEVGYEYGYRITAVDTSGNESSYSATKRATVADDKVAPNVLSIYPTTGAKISSDFEMSVACFDNIKLKTLTVSIKRTDSDIWQTLSETELNTYHKVTDIEIDTSSFTTGQYEFKAVVTDAYGNESTAKNVVYNYKTNNLSAPTLTAVGAGWRSELSWTMTNTEDISGYYIYRRGLTETSFRQIAGVNRTSYTDNNVNAGEKYFYQIEAIDSYGNKKTSESVSVIPTHEDEIKPTAYAGSDLLAIAGESVTFDGSRSGDNNYVQSYHWNFGDGNSSSSAYASHTYDSEGTYTATLTVTDSSSNSATDTVTVTVYGAENDSFTVKTVSDNGTKLPNVNIVCDEILGVGESCFTNSNGQYTFIAPSGTYTLYLYTDDYLPIKQTVNSNEDVTVTLIKKQVADGKLTVRELDYNEIVLLGIDPTAPENRHVFVYTVGSEYYVGSNGHDTKIYRNAEGDLITNNNNSGFHETYSKDGAVLWQFDNNKSTYTIPEADNDKYEEMRSQLKDLTIFATMEITTNLSWLKGFYSVDLTIMNNASEDFHIDHSLANITLPEGLSLADTANGNGVTKKIGKIAGGETKVISWIVRGDKAGTYDISAQFSGSLEPFGVQIEMEFETEQPIVVEAGNALNFEVVHDLWSENNDVWKIDYKLTNVGETTVYDIQFELLKDYVEKAEWDIKTMNIYHDDCVEYVHWVDGKPDYANAERWFDPLLFDIPDTTITLEPGEYLEFTVDVIKESIPVN
jgi:fibronectin type 3 domain-containing protein